MVFLSIVIPVYNAGWIIEKCLDSIWSQGLLEEEYEVVCVNDNSTDNTLEVLDKIAHEHKNLRVVSNTENLRAGGARNRGVREARGEYILFIDADDYYHAGGLKKAFDYQKEHRLDILMCDFARHNPKEENNNLVHNFQYSEIMTGWEFMRVNSLPWSPWKFLFKKSLMIDNDVFFEERVVCEDVDWVLRISFLANMMQYQPILLNHYILWKDSITALEYKNINFIYNRMFAAYRVRKLLSICRNKEEQKYICDVSNILYCSAVKYYVCFMTLVKDKVVAIEQYMKLDDNYSRFLSFVIRYPYLYSLISTLLSPIFRLIVNFKRIILKRCWI